MPAGTVDNHECVNMLGKRSAEIFKEKAHDSRIQTIEQEGVLVAGPRLDSANDVGAFETVLPRQSRTTTLECPDFCYDSLLAKSSFVLEPDLDGFAGMDVLLFLEELAGFFFQPAMA